MATEGRPFLISVRRRWLLWILPILALVYFAAVMTIVLGNYRIRGVTTDMLVLGGLAFFGLVILIELPFFLRRRAPKPPREKRVKERAPEPAAAQMAAPLEPDELMITQETLQGLKVAEYSSPPKSQNASSVYTKTHVPVSKEYVVRVETLVADASDL